MPTPLLEGEAFCNRIHHIHVFMFWICLFKRAYRNEGRIINCFLYLYLRLNLGEHIGSPLQKPYTSYPRFYVFMFWNVFPCLSEWNYIFKIKLRRINRWANMFIAIRFQKFYFRKFLNVDPARGVFCLLFFAVEKK